MSVAGVIVAFTVAISAQLWAFETTWVTIAEKRGWVSDTHAFRARLRIASASLTLAGMAFLLYTLWRA